jgi:hypothetical protein
MNTKMLLTCLIKIKLLLHFYHLHFFFIFFIHIIYSIISTIIVRIHHIHIHNLDEFLIIIQLQIKKKLWIIENLV